MYMYTHVCISTYVYIFIRTHRYVQAAFSMDLRHLCEAVSILCNGLYVLILYLSVYFCTFVYELLWTFVSLVISMLISSLFYSIVV